MKKAIFVLVSLTLIVPMLILSMPGRVSAVDSDLAEVSSTKKLRIIAFGAHPDDCEEKAGGVSAIWAALGHQVKFVSTTNGDIGNWRTTGALLAQRRTTEARQAAKTLGIESSLVLDNHDGELMPTLENRKKIVRLIREWKADIVLTHRTNDYHPDHRYTGVLVQDAAFMVTAPFFCPDVPRLPKNPVFLYYSDDFERPNPFRPDIVVAIDDVFDQKLDALMAFESQFIEGGGNGHEGLLAKNEAELAVRQRDVRNWLCGQFEPVADKYRKKLIELYGEDKGKKIKYAEAFEMCEYGRQASAAELKQLFPSFGR